MALLKIARMGHPVLRQTAQQVGDVTEPEIQRLIDDMQDTLVDANGVGLAAPQVHAPVRCLVYRSLDSDGAGRAAIRTLINPVLTVMDDTVDVAWEGCLSIPELRGAVPRWRGLRVKALDRRGDSLDFRVDGFAARVIQHETDHLNGVLYIDRMTDLSMLAFESEMHHFLSEEPDESDSD